MKTSLITLTVKTCYHIILTPNMIRKININLFILCLLGFQSHPIRAGSTFPPLFSAEYTIYAKGIPIGQWTQKLTQIEKDKFMLVSQGKTNSFIGFIIDLSIQESTIFTQKEDRVYPLKYVHQQTGLKTRQEEIQFDWTKKVARSVFNEKVKEIPLTDNTVDKLLYQILLMQALKQGKQHFHYKVVDKEKIKIYKPVFLGEEQIETGMGTFTALKYERSSTNKKHRTTLWCSPNLSYLPIQVEHSDKGDVFKMVLNSVQGLTSP